MNAKMKECFTPHALTHSLTGLGVGLILVSFIPALNNLWIGVAALVVGVVFDMMRKS